MPTKTLRSAAKRYVRSAKLAEKAVERANQTRTLGELAVVVAGYQAANARSANTAVTAMLLEQAINIPAEGRLNALAFTTSLDTLQRMLKPRAANLDRLVASLVQDAGRAAENVAAATRKRVGHVRYLQLPSCSRCAVLAGRWYSVSDGFLRHPLCDCVMVPTLQDAAPGLTLDVEAAVASGQVTGLSKADIKALEAGVDFGQVVNVRRPSRSNGLYRSGRLIRKGSRLTPEGIFRRARSHDEALELLRQFGYLT